MDKVLKFVVVIITMLLLLFTEVGHALGIYQPSLCHYQAVRQAVVETAVFDDGQVDGPITFSTQNTISFYVDTSALLLEGDTLRVPIKLSGVSSLLGFQISVQTTVEPLAIEPVEGIGNTFDSEYIGSLNTTSLFWYNNEGFSLSWADSTTVCYIAWLVSDLNDECVDVEFVDNPLPGLVVDGSGSEAIPTYAGATACIPQVPLFIAGRIRSIDGAPLSGISVANNLNTMLASDSQGAFRLDGLSVGADYVLEPLIDGEYLNGVNVADLVYIRDHLLGSDIFDDPLERVAADVDGNKQVQLLDLLQIRDLIVGFSDSLAVGSWQAVYQQPPLALPVENNLVPEFESFLAIDGLSGPIEDANFTAVKSGDVNGSADLDEAFSLLVMQEQAFKAGQTIQVLLVPDRNQPIDGAQLSLRFDPRSLRPLVSARKSAQERGYSRIYEKEEGLLNLIWLPENADTSGFMLTFTTLKTGYVSRSIKLDKSESALSPIVVRSGGVYPLAVVPAVAPKPSSAHVQLTACYPNPFDREITIALNSDQPEIVTVELVDLTGRIHYREERSLSQGQHTWHILTSGRIPAGSAVYFLKVQSSSGEQTVKLFRQ